MRAGKLGSTLTTQSVLSRKAALVTTPDPAVEVVIPFRNRALKYSARAVRTQRCARISTRWTPSSISSSSRFTSATMAPPPPLPPPSLLLVDAPPLPPLPPEKVSLAPLLLPALGAVEKGVCCAADAAAMPILLAALRPAAAPACPAAWTRNTQSMCSSSSSNSLMSLTNSPSSAAASGGSGFLRFLTIMVSPRCRWTLSGVSSFSSGLTK
mmetsp:Transcript_43904/g.133719  ORF Transcript_43904/g.133719 Transcript_43904/m.133719 type:complete len:211 (-) Transcript_43904:226-858(-)